MPEWRWSYSRLQQFHQCKYGWLLKYIFEEPSQKLFFSEYGKLMHELIARVLDGWATWEEAQSEYIQRFRNVLQCHGPPGSVRSGYFMDGLRYLQDAGENLAKFQPMAVEQYVEFAVGDHSFRGYIDLIARDADGALCIVDHKSRALKERSVRRKKSNAELDAYLRQLYLYAIPVAQKYGQPEKLIFNCFRSNALIVEPFSQAAQEEAIAWVEQTIAAILSEQQWLPSVEPWKCRHLCDVAGECEYSKQN